MMDTKNEMMKEDMIEEEMMEDDEAVLDLQDAMKERKFHDTSALRAHNC